MLEEYDTWPQVFDQTFEVRATNVSCLIERVADTLIKQLPREKAQISSVFSSTAEFQAMIIDKLMGNQANVHSEAIRPRKS